VTDLHISHRHSLFAKPLLVARQVSGLLLLALRLPTGAFTTNRDAVRHSGCFFSEPESLQDGLFVGSLVP
jgi:hypothetical protein